MRNSRVLRIMREGGVAVSTKCNFADPREAELAAEYEAEKAKYSPVSVFCPECGTAF